MEEEIKAIEEATFSKNELLRAEIYKDRAKNKREIFMQLGVFAATFGIFTAAKNFMNLDPGAIDVMRNIMITVNGINVFTSVDRIRKNCINIMKNSGMYKANKYLMNEKIEKIKSGNEMKM